MEKSNEIDNTVKTSRRFDSIFYRLIGLCCILSLYFCPSISLCDSCTGRSVPLAQYTGESLSWEHCGELNEHPLECSTLDVPLDHFDAVNSGNRTWSLALMRLRGKHGKQNILLNPGGPGGSGLNFLYRFGADLNTIVGEDFHLLTFDPRGVNQSFPSGSCYASSEARSAAILTKPKDIYTQSGLYAARSANLAQSCHDNMGDYGAYLNTPQTASDMNSILDAVGQEEMYYWGFSYGTTLGQTYAQMYPAKSKRVIIDGVSDQRSWYSDGPKEKMFGNDVQDTEAAFQGFVEECIHAGESCALSHDFEDATQLKQNLTNMLLSLRTQPLQAYVNASSWGEIGVNELTHSAVFTAMYKPKVWLDLAETLAGVLHGNYTDAFLKYGGKSLGSFFTNELGTFVANNDAATTAQSQRKDQELVEAVRNLERISPIAGTSFNEDLFLQREWRYPKSHDFVPAKRVETAHPLLILSTTYDPICPLQYAQRAEKTFVASVLVEQKNYGHCTISMPSLCKAKIVKAYLVNGTMPKKNTKCGIDASYFEPEKDALSTKVQSEDLQLLQALQHMTEMEF